MEASKKMPKRPRSEFTHSLRGGPSDKVISFLRHNNIAVSLYALLTDTLIPFVLVVVIVVPIGAVLLLLYLPKFYSNWRRRRYYGVETIHGTWASE
jgi:hypothetical protein